MLKRTIGKQMSRKSPLKPETTNWAPITRLKGLIKIYYIDLLIIVISSLYTRCLVDVSYKMGCLWMTQVINNQKYYQRNVSFSTIIKIVTEYPGRQYFWCTLICFVQVKILRLNTYSPSIINLWPRSHLHNPPPPPHQNLQSSRTLSLSFRLHI